MSQFDGVFKGVLFRTIRNPVRMPQPKCHQSPMPTRDHILNLRLMSDSPNYYDHGDDEGMWQTEIDDRTGIAYTYWVEWGTWKIGDEDVIDV